MEPKVTDAATLCNHLIRSLSDNKSIAEIHTFGSLNTGRYDQFSDVDMTILTGDLAATSVELDGLVGKLGSINAIHTVFEEPECAAYTYFLEGRSPYQKIDIDIRSVDNGDLFANSKKVYSRSNIARQKSKIIAKKQPKPDNILLNSLIGSLRYLKHVRRNEEWAAYKFYRGFVEQFLALHCGKLEGAISLDEYKKVEGRVSSDLFLNRDFNEMHQTYLNYLATYVSLIGTEVERSNLAFAQKLLGFWKDELSRVIKK